MCHTCKHPILHKTIIKSKHDQNKIKHLLHIPDLISKLYIFIPFYKSYFPYGRQNDTSSSKSNKKHLEFEFNFILICRYLNLVKNQGIILQQIENSQVATTLKFYTGNEVMA